MRHGSTHPRPHLLRDARGGGRGPRRTHAYVVALNTGTNGDKAPDALTVLDLEDGSTTYGQMVGRLDMPNVGDELHHFGWNACSSALCPWAAHPHIERRYLLVPGLRSSRIHIVDVRDDPHAPKLTKVIEAEEIASKTGYSRPHTIHCGPDGIYVSALGDPEGDGPGGIFLLDHENFSVKGAWEQDRGPQELAYDFWWHLNQGTVITSEWGTPNMVEGGLKPELLLSNQYGHKLHIWDLEKRKHIQEIDLGAEHQMVLELRPAHDPRKAYGFVGVVASTADLTASIWLWERNGDGTFKAEKVITIPPEPAETEQLPPALAAVRRGAAAGHRHRAVGRRPVARRLLLGHRRAQALRRLRPAQPARDGLRAPRRHRRARAAPGRRRAQRRPADGRAVARRQARLPDELALRLLGRAVLPRGHRRLARQARRAARTARWRSTPTCSSSTAASARTRSAWRAATRRATRTASPTDLMDQLWPWILLGLLGAYHGLNPAMGWLFAVALGMQERDRKAVVRALPAIAIGHEASIVLVAALVLGLGRDHRSVGAAPRRRHRADRVRRVPLRQAARALPLGADDGQPARADVVVVPDVDRPRRGADGRAGADRRRRGDRGLGVLGPRARRRAGQRALDPGQRAGHHAARRGDARGHGASSRCWSTTTSGSTCSRSRGSTSTRCGRARSCWPGC